MMPVLDTIILFVAWEAGWLIVYEFCKMAKYALEDEK